MIGRLERKATVSSVSVGAFIAASAVLISATTSYFSSASLGQPSKAAFGLSAFLDWIIVGTLLSPLLETFFFSLVANFTLKNPNKGGTLFVVLMAGLGWLIHGASLDALSRAFGFLVLALWFLICFRRLGAVNAYIYTFFAHASWNLVLVLLWTFRNLT